MSVMAKKPKKRPGILLRMYPQDITNLNAVCAERCTPRENYARRAVLAQVDADMASIAAAKEQAATSKKKVGAK